MEYHKQYRDHEQQYSGEKQEHQKEEKYLFETFEAVSSDFDNELSSYINTKYNSGWEYEDCQFETYGNSRRAYCIFEKD